MRVQFKSKRARDLFFGQIRNKFVSWKEFYGLFAISRKTFENYKSGKLTMPFDFYDKVSNRLNLKKEEVKYIEDNWGRIKGGNAAYLTNKDAFELGREKLLAKLRNRIPKFDINLLLSSEIAYFIGLFIGDGFSNKYGHSYMIQFTGHISEFNFYNEFVSEIIYKNFNLNPKIKEDKYVANTLRVNLSSKDLFLLITERFKIAAGRKSYTVLIPEEIVKSPFVLDCVAGIFDAEGCSYFDVRKTYKQKYPCINVHMNNPGIVKQMSEILTANNVSNSTSKGYANTLIYGERNVRAFLQKVKVRNPKFLEKIKIYC